MSVRTKIALIVSFLLWVLILSFIVVSAGGEINLPPTARFTATPNFGVAPLTVTFNAAQSSDTDGSIVSYEWDFGDGQSTSGVNVSHTFTEETTTTYTVTLTVTDDDGATSTCTEVVTVEVIPLLMTGHDASRSGCSPHAGIDNPWMIPITFDGYEEVAPGSPLIIGRGGIIFLTTGKINRPEEIIAVRADPESPETCQVLWRFPLYTYAPCPAIEPDGTVYVWDINGILVGLDPDSGTKVWDSGYDGKKSYLYDIQVSRDGIICASTSKVTLVYSSAPEHQLIYQLKQGGFPGFAPNGTLYLLKPVSSGKEVKILVLDQEGKVMWEQIFSYDYDDVCSNYMFDQESNLYMWKSVQYRKDRPAPYIIAITCDGTIRWERTFSNENWFSEPVLGSDGTIYIMTRSEPKQGEFFLHAINKEDGIDRWSRGLTEILSAAGVEGTERVVSGYNSKIINREHPIIDSNGVVYFHFSPSEWNRKEDGELLLIDGYSGDLIQRIVNAGQYYILGPKSRNMAMNSDGTLYLASVNSLMATVPNEPPRIVDLRIRSAASYHYPLQRKYEVSYSEPSNAVGFWFECIIDDPLWGGRNLTLTWDFGDGTTKSQDITIRKGKYPRRRSEKNPQGYLTYKVSHTYDHPGVYFVTATLAVDCHSETFVQDGILACGIPPTLVYMSQEGKGSQVLSGGVFGGEEVDLNFKAELPDCLQTLLVGNRDMHFYWNLHNAPGFWVNTGSYDRGSGKTLRGGDPVEDPVSVTYCFTRPGTYEVTLKVWENDWPIPIEKTVWINILAPPTAAFEFIPSLLPEVGQSIQFDGSNSSDIDGKIVSYNWNFGNGKGEYEQQQDCIDHIFSAAREYLVTLTVTDNDGKTSQISQNIVINPKLKLTLSNQGRTLTSNRPIFVSRGEVGAEIDLDGDGIWQEWEDKAMEYINPNFELDEGEEWFDHPEHHVVNFVRVFPYLKDDSQYILFIYCVTWSKDYGRAGVYDHNGDVERVIMAWEVVDEEGKNLELKGVYTSAHEGYENDHSAFWDAWGRNCFTRGIVAWPFDEEMCGELKFEGKILTLQISEDKHAIFPTFTCCEDVILAYLLLAFVMEDCGGGGEWRFDCYNVGEPSHYLIDDLDNPSFWEGLSEDKCSALIDLFSYEQVWSGRKGYPDKFCGGLSFDEGAPRTIGNRLKDIPSELIDKL